MTNEMRRFGTIMLRILFSCFFVAVGSAAGILAAYYNHLESINDYQINIIDHSGITITIYARGEQKGLLGQYEAITLSPENISSRNWTYQPQRDLKYEGENYILYRIEDGLLRVYSQQILVDKDFSSWGIQVQQESSKTIKKYISQATSHEYGYSIISTKGMTE